jgi:hypothetical protein
MLDNVSADAANVPGWFALLGQGLVGTASARLRKKWTREPSNRVLIRLRAARGPAARRPPGPQQ